ncbi:DegT/DnrJ/EryC1/StrS family aminotransferase [Acidobacteriota bacterium]
MQIPLSNPDITDLEKHAVQEVLNTPNLSLGPKIPEFENAAANFVGVKFAAAMSGSTAVLHTIVNALGIGKGDLVLTTPFSFVATANCLLYEGAKPIFVDIDEDTYNITPESVEQSYLTLPPEKREKVKAVIYVDVFGVPADGPGFEFLGEKYGLRIVDDAAEALGSAIKGRKCGSFGDAGLFAFYPNKQITTGEGGILLTDNEEIFRIAVSLRNQGRDSGAGWLQHARLGYNYRMSDINAALGMAQISRIEEMLAKRRRVREMYNHHFSSIFARGFLLPQKTPPGSFVSPFVYVLRLPDNYTWRDRDRLLSFLREAGIQCSNYFTPVHLQPYFKKLGWKYGDMPIAETISERTVALPFYNNLTEKQVEYVVQKVEDFFTTN